MMGQNFMRLNAEQQAKYRAMVAEFMAQGALFGTACMMARGYFGLYIPENWR